MTKASSSVGRGPVPFPEGADVPSQNSSGNFVSIGRLGRALLTMQCTCVLVRGAIPSAPLTAPPLTRRHVLDHQFSLPVQCSAVQCS